MANDNMITVCGTTVRDFELRYTSGGRAVASAGVAQNDRFFSKEENKWVDGDANFFNVTAWGDLGEHAAECLTKGTRVIVTGKMKQRSYETAEGEKRTVWDLIADDIGPSLKWASATVVKTVREKPAETKSTNDLPERQLEESEPF
jgi:single-strand DNA-binding protein